MRPFHFLIPPTLLLLCCGRLPANPDIVFVSRALRPLPPGAPPRTAAVERAEWGQLRVLRTGSRLETLVDGKNAAPEVPLDVMDPEVSPDGNRIVFSGFSPKDQAFRIFEIGANGSGLRQLTHSDRQIDLTRHGEEAEKLLSGYD